MQQIEAANDESLRGCRLLGCADEILLGLAGLCVDGGDGADDDVDAGLLECLGHGIRVSVVYSKIVDSPL